MVRPDTPAFAILVPSVWRNWCQLTAAASPLESMRRIRFSQASNRVSTVP